MNLLYRFFCILILTSLSCCNFNFLSYFYFSNFFLADDLSSASKLCKFSSYPSYTVCILRSTDCLLLLLYGDTVCFTCFCLVVISKEVSSEVICGWLYFYSLLVEAWSNVFTAEMLESAFYRAIYS